MLDTVFPTTVEAPARQSPGPRYDSPVATGEARHVATEGQGKFRGSWCAICTLELRGESVANIARAMQMSANAVSKITRREDYITYREQRLAELDNEFFAMKPLALAALRGGLNSLDENTALRASEQWFKGASFGGFAKNPEPARQQSAEDVVAQLLNAVQVNVTVVNEK